MNDLSATIPDEPEIECDVILRTSREHHDPLGLRFPMCQGHRLSHRGAGLSVGVAVEFFRDRRPVDGRGVEGREFVGGVPPVRVRRGVAARGPKLTAAAPSPTAV